MRAFSPNCTLPDHALFVSSCNIRGTLDIVWSCLSILVLCTWTVLHLNVPQQSEVSGFRPRTVRTVSRLWHKVRWMLWNILAPEWNLGKAYADYVAVERLYSRSKSNELDDETWKRAEWSRTKIYLANMGGFNIRFDGEHSLNHNFQTDSCRLHVVKSETKRTAQLSHEPTADQSSENHTDRSKSNPLESSELYATTNNPTKSKNLLSDNKPEPVPDHVHKRIRDRVDSGFFHECFEADAKKALRLLGEIDWCVNDHNRSIALDALSRLHMTYFKGSAKSIFRGNPDAWLCNLRVLCGSTWVVDANQLRLARKYGIIDRLPEISDDQLDDLNKGDIFFKIVALGQITWLIIQLGTRLGQGQPTTQLEVLTLAFAISSILTYALLFNKPRNIETSISVAAARYPIAEEMIDLATAGPEAFGIMDSLRRDGTMKTSGRLGLRIENDCTHMGTQGKVLLGGAAALALFGALHCIAWNFDYPSRAEQMIWRVCAVVTAAAGPLFLVASLPVVGFALLKKRAKHKAWALPFLWLFNGCTYAYIGIMVAARIIVIVEVLRSLAYQPAGTFVTTEWPANLPHIG